MSLLLALVFALLPTQATKGLNGTWVAELNGVTFIRLELNIVDGRITGAIGTGNIHLDGAGVVDSAESAPSTLTPIANVTITNNVMSFTRVEGNDEERFQIRVTGDTAAELTFLPSEEDLADLKDAGVPAPKPMPLRKIR